MKLEYKAFYVKTKLDSLLIFLITVIPTSKNGKDGGEGLLVKCSADDYGHSCAKGQHTLQAPREK